MAKKNKRKMSFRGKVKKDNKNHESSGGKFSVLNLPDGVELYKPEVGARDVFDIIPYVVTSTKHPDKDEYTSGGGQKETIAHKGDIWYKFPYKTHKDIGSDNQTVICLETFGKPCPICEYKKAQQEKGVEWEELKIYKPKDRVLYIIKPVKIKKAKDAFYILDMSFYLFQKQLNQETNEDEDYEDFPLLEGGYSLKVRWVEGQMKTANPYAEAGRIDFEQRDEDYDESILDEVPNLDECLKELSYDKLKALFFEDDSDEDEDTDESPFKEDEEEEKPKKKTSKKKTKKEPEEKQWDWYALKTMELDDLTDACETYELDAEEIAGDADDEDETCDLLRKALADELDIEVPKEKKKKAKKEEKKPSKKSTKEPKCPEDGMAFGVSTDESEACDNCGLLEACIKKNEEE